MDAETQAAWDRWADARIRLALKARFAKHYDELEQLVDRMGKTIAKARVDTEDRMEAKFEKRIGELEVEIKALRSELAVNKTLGDIDERLAKLEAGRPGLRVA